MKKITLFIAALVVGIAINAQVTITHNNSQTIVDGLGLTCQDMGITTDNKFHGVFDLANDFSITNDWLIESVEFGVDETINAPGDAYDVAVNAYTTDSGDPNGTLTLLGGGMITLSSADDLSVVLVPFTTPAVVPAGEVLVIELVVLDDGQTGFRLGATDVASNDDSWLLADACGLPTAATYASIGFGDRWHIMNVIGDDVLGVGDNLSEFVSIYPNPARDVLNIKLPSNIEIISSNLYDISGKDTGVKLVDGTMDTSNLARGVYLINIKTSAGTLTEKVIKQ
ncbi:MAG: T9SS type A sorting domain-containing protein [Bacteroidetes bacterium]|nr:T9SS type A sorting domain-containing protein [Bacteroidota bacterium]